MSSESKKNLKSERQICYDSRDLYLECFERTNGDKNQCRAEFKKFNDDCPVSWVQHFIRKHEFEKYKKNYLDENQTKLKDDNSIPSSSGSSN